MRVLLALLLGVCAVVPAASAQTGAYTDAAAFAAGAPGPVFTVDFEALADGTIVSGST